MDVEKLTVAWRRVKVDRRTDFVIGDFEYNVYDKYSRELMQEILSEGSGSKDYSPNVLRQIRVPKSLYTTRPGAVPEITDRIVYQYLVDEVAETVEKSLVPIDDGIVHSYRYRGERSNPNMFFLKEASYKTFEEKTLELSKQYKYIVVTDISSYFERIYHHELENTLRGLGVPTEVVSSLMNLLRKWAKGKSYGITQGLWPSDYLGNIYLDPVDKFIVRSKYGYCRYMDDMRIGVDSALEAQHLMQKLEAKLAEFGLALNGGKTKLVPQDGVEHELFPYKKQIQEIRELRGLFDFDESTDEDVSFTPYDFDMDFDFDVDLLFNHEEDGTEDDIESVIDLFREQLSKDQVDTGVMRFCFKQLKRANEDSVLEDVVDNLDKLLVVTPRVVDYLVRIYGELKESKRRDIRSRILEHINKVVGTHDWQTMWMLHCLGRFNDVRANELQPIRDLILDGRQQPHDAVLVNAIILLGKHGDSADWDVLLNEYDKNYSSWVKRAILYAIRGLPVTKRNHFYNYCVGQDLLTDKTIQYIKEIKK